METNKPKSLTDVIWEEFQQQAVEIGHKAVDLASSSVLYVAKEIVFALSGDVAAADTDQYGMRNDVEEEEVEIYGEDDDSLLKKLEKELQREKSKSKKSRKKHKKDKDKTRKAARSPDEESPDVEKRDEESERSQKVEELIKKFDTSGVTVMPKKWRSSTGEGNVGRTPAMKKPTYDILVTNSSKSQAVQSSTPKQNNSVGTTTKQTYDTMVVRPLSNAHGNQPQEAQQPGKSQDIFRPRSASKIALDDSERFAYLVGGGRTRGPPKPENMFSPFAPFREIHRANKALLDDTTFDTRSDRESTHPSSHEPNVASASAIQGKTGDIPEIVDIRTEIEDIQRIIAKLEQERAQRRLQGENGVDALKDPMKAEEIRILIHRLARLSQRHRELKSKNARSDLPVDASRDNAVIDLSRHGETETRVPPAM